MGGRGGTQAGGGGGAAAAPAPTAEEVAMNEHVLTDAEAINRRQFNAEMDRWAREAVGSEDRRISSIYIAKSAYNDNTSIRLATRDKDGGLSGIMAMSEFGDRRTPDSGVYISWLGGSPTKAGRGAGRRLVYEAAKKLLEGNGSRIVLTPLNGARPFYASIGFKGTYDLRLSRDDARRFVERMEKARRRRP